MTLPYLLPSSVVHNSRRMCYHEWTVWFITVTARVIINTSSRCPGCLCASWHPEGWGCLPPKWNLTFHGASQEAGAVGRQGRRPAPGHSQRGTRFQVPLWGMSCSDLLEANGVEIVTSLCSYRLFALSWSCDKAVSAFTWCFKVQLQFLLRWCGIYFAKNFVWKWQFSPKYESFF